jgi:hypothetical protein
MVPRAGITFSFLALRRSGILFRPVFVPTSQGSAGALVEDAESLAKYERLLPGTNGFNEFVQPAVA